MSNADETTLSRDIGGYLRYQLRGWRGLILALVALAMPALWFGWPWLVAAGVAPLLLAIAPCAVMCALGLCMGRGGKTPDVGSTSHGAAGSAPPHASAGSKSEPSPSLAACCAEKNRPAETEAPR